MANEIVKSDTLSEVEQLVVMGDLAKLQAPQRLEYYRKVCESVGLNPFTRPFEYITLNSKLTLYARKDATDQLRKLNGVSIVGLERDTVDGVFIVIAHASMPDGRSDEDTGAVSIKGLSGDALANAMMKAITKAKRRVTLSICGLGWLDETELETIPSAARVVVAETGEIVQTQPSGNGNGNGNQGATESPVIADARTLKHLHACGESLYGNEWDTKRHVLVSKATKGRTESSKDLTQAEADKLITGIEAKLQAELEKVSAEMKAEPEFEIPA